MATTLVHEPPSAKLPGGDGVRFVAVRANLLPDEIVSGRQLDVVRKQVVLGLLVVVALLIGWYGLSWWQTAAAHSQLDDAQHRTTALTRQQDQFGPLVQAQNETATVRRQLQGLMAYDVPWKTVVASVRTSAPAGVTLSTVTATVNAGVGSTAGGAPVAALPLDRAGTLPIGQITLTGRAGSKNAVAAYADGLGRLPGLAAPLITSVTAAPGAVTFSVTVSLTTAALGGRYSTGTPAPTGGK